MPEYLAPGVFIEETAYRTDRIEGVAMSTCAFVGPTLRGPDEGPPRLLTSFADFERVHGGAGDLATGALDAGNRSNLVAQAARAFFGNGGTRLYVVSTGTTADPGNTVAALARLEAASDVAIVAAPGHSALTVVRDALLAHVAPAACYRMAVLDAPRGADLATVRAWRSQVDSSHAALYYPWVVTPDGVQPPAGFVCGIYARVDAERGVHKAPANEVVRGALRFERNITDAEQDILNPLGVNCLRAFTGRGLRVWGARTMSSDPEWRHVSVRRYVCYLEASLERGLQWAVFEPNLERLWARVREAVAEFLMTEWRKGALLGRTDRDAFYVRCDRSTMTRNDLDNGRLLCQVGVALVKPTEFVVLKIGLWTADAQRAPAPCPPASCAKRPGSL